VLSVKQSMRGESDELVLSRGQAEGRVVLTHDKDFSELAFHSRLPATCGVVLFRLTGTNPDTDNRRVLQVLESRTDWPGHFAVVTDDRIRIRPLPALPNP
jgi:predicted nuclease of predicted toxin-antitoxin system